MALKTAKIQARYMILVIGIAVGIPAQAARIDPKCVLDYVNGKWVQKISQGIETAKERLGIPVSTRAKALEFNSGKINATGFYVENGVPGDVGGTFLKAGGPSGNKEGASRSVLGKYVPYSKEIRDAEVGPAPGKRYVSLDSLEQQLQFAEAKVKLHPLDRLPPGKRTFAYSNTVATNNGNGSAWQGLNFRLDQNGPTYKVRMHVRLLDGNVEKQKEAVAVSGVNLVHGAYAHLAKLKETTDPIARQNIMKKFVESLGDGFRNRRVEIDMIELEGEIFKGEDPRQIGYNLIQAGLTKHVLFAPNGKMVSVYDSLYNKPLVSFYHRAEGSRPIATHVREAVAKKVKKDPKDVLLVEMVGTDELKTHMKLDPNKFAQDTHRPNWVLVSDPMKEGELSNFWQTVNRAGQNEIIAGHRNPNLSDVVEVPNPSGKGEPVRIYYGDPANQPNSR